MPKRSTASNLMAEICDALNEKLPDAVVKIPRSGAWPNVPIAIAVSVRRPADIAQARALVLARFNLLEVSTDRRGAVVIEAYVPPNNEAPGEKTYPSFRVRISAS